MKLAPILKNLSGFYDMRTEISKFVTGNTLIWSKAYKWLNENSILCEITKEIEENNFSGDEENDYLKSVTITEESSNIDKIWNNKINNNPNLNNNNPNININIINGCYNQIVYTEGNEVREMIELDNYEYKPSFTETDVPQKTKNNITLNKLLSNNQKKRTPFLFKQVLNNKNQNKNLITTSYKNDKKINKPVTAESSNNLENKNTRIVTPYANKPIKNHTKNNMNDKIKQHSADLRNFNISNIIKNMPIGGNSKDLNEPNKNRKNSDSNLKYKMNYTTKGRSLDFNYLKREEFKLNPIEKLNFIKIKSIDLTDKNKKNFFTTETSNLSNCNNENSPYNSFNNIGRLMTENILIQDDSCENFNTEPKEKFTIPDYKFFKNSRDTKKVVMNNYLTETNRKLSEMKRIYTTSMGNTKRPITNSKVDDSKVDKKEGAVKVNNIYNHTMKITKISELHFNKSSLNKIKFSNFTTKSK